MWTSTEYNPKWQKSILHQQKVRNSSRDVKFIEDKTEGNQWNISTIALNGEKEKEEK